MLSLKTGGGKQSQQVGKETSDFNVSKNLFRLTGRLMFLTPSAAAALFSIIYSNLDCEILK